MIGRVIEVAGKVRDRAVVAAAVIADRHALWQDRQAVSARRVVLKRTLRRARHEAERLGR